MNKPNFSKFSVWLRCHTCRAAGGISSKQNSSHPRDARRRQGSRRIWARRHLGARPGRWRAEVTGPRRARQGIFPSTTPVGAAPTISTASRPFPATNTRRDPPASWRLRVRSADTGLERDRGATAAWPVTRQDVSRWLTQDTQGDPGRPLTCHIPAAGQLGLCVPGRLFYPAWRPRPRCPRSPLGTPAPSPSSAPPHGEHSGAARGCTAHTALEARWLSGLYNLRTNERGGARRPGPCRARGDPGGLEGGRPVLPPAGHLPGRQAPARPEGTWGPNTGLSCPQGAGKQRERPEGTRGSDSCKNLIQGTAS